MQWLSNLFQVLAKFFSKTQSCCFKALYERSNAQLLSWSTLYITFYQQKIDRNAKFKLIVPSAGKIYQ